MPNSKVPVPEGITTHQGVIHEIEIREPTLGDLMEFGEPYAYTRSPDGQPFVTEIPSTIRQYFERCLVSPKDPIVVESCTLKTGYAVKRAVLRFFQQDASEGEPSTISEKA